MTKTPGKKLDFTPMNLDELEQQERQIGFGQNNSQFFSFKDGRNVIRFLPGKGGQKAFVPFFKHFVKGAEGGKALSGPCPNKMAKLPCAVCNAAAKLTKGSDADLDLAKDIGARSRVVASIIDRSAPDAGPQVAEFGPQVYNAVKDYMRTMGEDPTNPYEGFDMVIEKTGSGLKTEYKVNAVRKNSPLHADERQMEEWMNDAPDLTQYIVLPSAEEQTIKLAGTIVAHLLSTQRQTALPAGRGRTDRASSRQALAQPDADDDVQY